MICLGALAAGLPHHSREGVQVRRRVPSRPAAGAISTGWRWRIFSNPLMVGLLRAQHARRRLAPVARRRRARSSRSASIIRGGRRGSWPPASARRRHRRRLHRHRAVGASRGRRVRMTLDAKIPAGPIAEKWDRHKFEMKLVNPANKRKYTIICRRHRPRRRVGRRVARRAGLQRPELLHPGQPAARAQHRGAGRHQRREELPERRRQHLPPLLRHGQGRRLPLARSQRLPAGAAERRTSSTSASRRACRSRASTAGCSTTARSAARRCRAPSTPAARPASSCCSAPISR